MACTVLKLYGKKGRKNPHLWLKSPPHLCIVLQWKKNAKKKDKNSASCMTLEKYVLCSSSQEWMLKTGGAESDGKMKPYSTCGREDHIFQVLYVYHWDGDHMPDLE